MRRHELSWKAAAAVLAALALLAGACGDDSSSLTDAVEASQDGGDGVSDSDDSGADDAGSDDSGDSSSGDSGSDDGDSGSDDGSSDSGGDFGEGADTDFCQFVAQIDEGNDTLASDITTLDPDGLEAAYADIEDLIDQAASRAPGPIEADVRYLADSFKSFRDLLDENGYDLFALSDPDVQNDPRFEPFNTGEIEAASDRINAFCGIDDSAGGATEPDTEIPELGDDQMREIMIQSLAAGLGIDEDLAVCLVDELELDDPTNIDPSAFGDLSREVCGTTIGEIFAGG